MGDRPPPGPDPVEAALEAGRRVGEEVLAEREEAARRRVEALALSGAAPEHAGLDMPMAEAGGAFSRGILLAEGDSWFDLPGKDVLDGLEDIGFDIESVAHRGHLLESMAYDADQLEGFARAVDRIFRDGKRPKAILLSAGGNDVVGDEFPVLLEHAKAPFAGTNPEIVAAIIDNRLRFAYIALLSAVTVICSDRFQGDVTIILHGYSHPVPDGRGFKMLGLKFAGPWMEPGFVRKGYRDSLADLKVQVAALIDRFNDMLERVTGMPPFAHVHHLDLRGTLSSGDDYKDSWRDELHPTEGGVRKIVAAYESLLATV
jgi:hypothetical protein